MVNRPMRIAMLSVHTCPLATLGGKKTGGMNVYVRELSKELSRQGVYVDIFTRSQDPCVPHINDAALGDCARVIHIPTGPEEPLDTTEIHPHLPEFVDNVQQFAADESNTYDLIHSHYWLSGLAAIALSEAWGKTPILQMFHTLGRMKNRIAGIEGGIEDDLRIRSEHQIMENAHKLVAATPAERIQLMWLYGADMKDIEIIPPGVDISHFSPIHRATARQKIGLSEDAHLLLFVGRIEKLKGIDTLLHAIALLQKCDLRIMDTLSLSIIGGILDEDQENSEMERLHALHRELGLDDFVTFLGARSQETLQYYYSAAEAVIMPSHYESFGMVALEAMACGTPVVASEVGGLAYLIQDGVTGFHVPVNEPDELAGKIRLILENAALRQEMAKSAVEYAQKYSWPRIAAQITDLYQKTLA